MKMNGILALLKKEEVQADSLVRALGPTSRFAMHLDRMHRLLTD